MNPAPSEMADEMPDEMLRGLDLTTTEGILTFCEWCRGDMVRRFMADGQMDPFIDGWVIAQCQMPDFEPGAELLPGPKLPRAVPLGCPLREGGPISGFAELYAIQNGVTDRDRLEQIEKDMYAHSVRTFIKGTAACGFVFMSETWYMDSRRAKKKFRPPKGKDWRWFKGQVKHQPDRLEMLMLSLEHKTAGSRFWRAQIERNPTRVLPWEDLSEGLAMSGRFTGLLGKLDWS